MQAKRLPFSRKLAFAVCDIFGGGSFNIINFLYPGFLAVTVGLSAYHIGLVMLIGPRMGRGERPSDGLFKRRNQQPPLWASGACT